MPEPYDALIVGGGPAGLSAALILGRCRRRVLICSYGHPRNFESRAVHGLLGHEGLRPEAYLTIGQRELARYETISYQRCDVTSVTPSTDGFAFVCADGTSGGARKVLLATGLIDELPDLDGIQDLYGKSVHHCLYCDGFEHRDQPLAAYGDGDKGAGLALMMRQWSHDVILCTDGGSEPRNDLSVRLAQHDIMILPHRLAALEGKSGRLERIRFQNGNTIARSALFFATGCRQKSNLSQKLGCTRDQKGGIITDPLTEETAVKGVYVAGDVSRDVLLVAVAAGEGAKAGVAINRALLKEDGLL